MADIRLAEIRRTEAEIRLELRRNGGHRGKVSQEILIWLDDFEEMKAQEMNSLEANYSRLIEDASSLLASHGSSAVDRMIEQSVSPTLVGESAQLVLNQVCDYLADPEIGIIGLYGQGGVGKTTILKNLNNLLMKSDMFDKIIWVTMSQSATIQTVQDQIAVQLGITLPTNVREMVELPEPYASGIIEGNRASVIRGKLANLGKCLIILDHMWDAVNLSSIGIPDQVICNFKVVLTTRSSQVCQQMRAQKQIRVSPLSERNLTMTCTI